jgi:Cu(I)/Ag(I) efflux system protein CusF
VSKRAARREETAAHAHLSIHIPTTKGIDMKKLMTAIATGLWMLASVAGAASPEEGPAQAAQADSTAMADGEVRKIDKENKKITLRHGEIKNLGMPGMTMVFQVRDPALLDTLKQGDKVRFSADKINGAYVATAIEVVK